MTKPSVTGTLPSIIRNDEELYEGNLVYYFQILYFHARNLNRPYHNFRHICHVLWLCYKACDYYEGTLTPREMRNLLIAVIFHDFNHTGMQGNDDVNIILAIRGLEKHILPEDKKYFEDIAEIIRNTQFPYTVSSDKISLSGQIIRDSDMSQVYSVAWIQEVVFGLASEWGQKPIEILRMQNQFINTTSFHTEWAQQLFKDEDREAKLAEVNALLDILELKPANAPQ